MDDTKDEVKPFGAEFLEPLCDEDMFGAGGTSVCTSYTTAPKGGGGDSGDDGCSSD